MALIPKVITSLINNPIVLDDVRGFDGTVVTIPALASMLDLTNLANQTDLADSFHLAHLASVGDITVNSTFDTSKMWLSDILTAFGTPLPGQVLTATASYILSPGAANLGRATGMAVLGASTVTNTGNTVLTGDLGLFPGTSVTGFPPGTLSGHEHIADAYASGAQTDAQAAYTNLAGRPGAINESGNVLGTGGTVPMLTAGVYSFTSSAQLTGALTLHGSATDVFIFQIGTTLTTASSSSVVLTGGALPQNVFWQVGSSATLGTSTAFQGTIIAQASITVNGGVGASVNGELIALTGAVTFAAATNVNASAPAEGPVSVQWM